MSNECFLKRDAHHEIHTGGNSVSTVPKRPIAPYFGGKWQLAKWILRFIPPHTTYLEPFCGMASVFFQKTPAKGSVLNDKNEEIVNIYRVLRDPERAERLIALLELTPYSKTEYIASHEPSDDPVEQARRTIFRLHAAFASDCHIPGRISGFKIGFEGKQSHAWRRYPPHLKAIIHRLQGVTLENQDALWLLRTYGRCADVLAFVDPPYLLSTRTGGKVYRYEMDEQQHQDLAQTLHQFAGMVILSGYPSKLYDELYPGWQCVTRTAHTSQNTKRTEALWLSPRTQAALDPAVLR